MDLSKLNRAQLDIAEKVALEAEKQGLDPKFVLALAMAESGLNPKAVSSKGALGVMQLMPDTAKSLKVDPQDVDQNIEGGVRFIRRLVSNKNIGNDPVKVLMGYNAGPGTKFFQTGKVEDLPAETVNYIVRIENLLGGNLPRPQIGDTERPQESQAGVTVPGLGGTAFTEPARDSGPSAITVPSLPGEGGAGGTQVGGTDADIDEIEEAQSAALRTPAAIAGGVLGTGTAATGEVARRVIPTVLGAISPGRSIEAVEPVSRSGLQRYLASQIPGNVKMTISELERLTGSPIRTTSEVQSALRAIEGAQAQRVGKTTSIDPVTGRARKIYRSTAGTAPIDLSAYQTKPPGPIATAVARDASIAGDVLRGARQSAGRIAVGGLGGVTAGLSAYDALELADRMRQRYKAGEDISNADVARLGTKTLSAIGGGLSMIPVAPAQTIGLGLQAPEAAWAAYDLYRNTRPSALDALGGAMTPEAEAAAVMPPMTMEEASRPAFISPRALPRRTR